MLVGVGYGDGLVRCQHMPTPEQAYVVVTLSNRLRRTRQALENVPTQPVEGSGMTGGEGDLNTVALAVFEKETEAEAILVL
jgi:hypothetical protein